MRKAAEPTVGWLDKPISDAAARLSLVHARDERGSRRMRTTVPCYRAEPAACPIRRHLKRSQATDGIEGTGGTEGTERLQTDRPKGPTHETDRMDERTAGAEGVARGSAAAKQLLGLKKPSANWSRTTLTVAIVTMAFSKRSRAPFARIIPNSFIKQGKDNAGPFSRGLVAGASGRGWQALL